MSDLNRVRVLKDDRSGPDLHIVESNGEAWAVVWPGEGAELRSIHHISLGAAGRTTKMTHPMEAVYYVMRGNATAIDPRGDTRQNLVEGSMAHVEPGTPYIFEAGMDGAEIIGGPCPADHAMYSHIDS